ncbi:MAG: FtsX-like permease family protein [Pirellulaceae bacterium]|nr:FtsX-like permease family protein [Pirellulaceae bacterium]
MFKLLLSWRYLKTRYIALASIISVTLGVATLIVVNSVMEGFTATMHARLHGVLSDIVIEGPGINGFGNVPGHVNEIKKVVGKDLKGVTATVKVPAMLNYKVRTLSGEQWITHQILLIGIDEKSYADVSDFSNFLLHENNRKQLDFLLQESGYDPKKNRIATAGWQHRRKRARFEKNLQLERGRSQSQSLPSTSTQTQQTVFRPPVTLTSQAPLAQDDAQQQSHPPQIELPKVNAISGQSFSQGSDPFKGHHQQTQNLFDPETEQHTGIILGISLVSQSIRNQAGEVTERCLAQPGDDVKVTFPSTGTPPQAVSDSFTIVDLYESKMSEYDSSFAFVPLSRLQDLRGMVDPQTNDRSVSAIQIKLHEGAKLNEVRDKLQKHFPAEIFHYRIRTWQDLQGPLLHAVQMETTILNILLFLIIAVAGFGILATFFMIVVEKTRDIGVLKALGASSSGVMSIFLGYGVSLGIVGAGVGSALGILFVNYINEIADIIGYLTGREVFDPTIYYFKEIPVILSPNTIVMVALGAITIAILASVLPAARAARLHPVEALRYE